MVLNPRYKRDVSVLVFSGETVSAYEDEKRDTYPAEEREKRGESLGGEVLEEVLQISWRKYEFIFRHTAEQMRHVMDNDKTDCVAFEGNWFTFWKLHQEEGKGLFIGFLINVFTES